MVVRCSLFVVRCSLSLLFVVAVVCATMLVVFGWVQKKRGGERGALSFKIPLYVHNEACGDDCEISARSGLLLPPTNEQETTKEEKNEGAEKPDFDFLHNKHNSHTRNFFVCWLCVCVWLRVCVWECG